MTFVAVVATRRVILSLVSGVLAGALLRAHFSLSGLLLTGQYLAGAVAQRENAYILIFLTLFGALARLIDVAGGVSGFTDLASKWAKTERRVLLVAWFMLPITFFDNVFHILSVGSILEPLMEKVKGVKERLAFVLAVTTGQAIVLVPLGTAYAGYMVSLVRMNMPASGHVWSPFSLFLRSILWNFYSIAMLLIALGVSLFGLKFGQKKITVASSGEEFTPVHKQREAFLAKLPPEYPARAMNLVIPLALFLAATILFLWTTGRERASTFLGALGAADFSAAVMTGALVTLGLTVILFRAQGISLIEIETHLIEGAQGVLTLVAILVLSWALSQVVRDLGFTGLVSSVLARSVPAWAIPVAIFLAGAAMSYVIGSSWATWALLVPLGATLAQVTGVDLALVFGAAWAGGSVGDSTSPVADLPVLVSGVAKIDVAGYAGAALPYALAGMLISVILYAIAGARPL